MGPKCTDAAAPWLGLLARTRASVHIVPRRHTQHAFPSSADRSPFPMLAHFVFVLSAFHGDPDSVARAAKRPSLASTDSIVVEKKKHQLTLFAEGVPIRTYLVALGNPVGDKQRQGDKRTPEGTYRIDRRNPQSQYYRSLHISYPDAAHAAQAKSKGVSPGGDIMIHGLAPQFASAGAAHRTHDWTEGCI